MNIIRLSPVALASLLVVLCSVRHIKTTESLDMRSVEFASASTLHSLRVSTLIANPPQDSSASAPASATSSDIPLPDGTGRDKAKAVCGTCHGTDIFAKQRHTKDEWGAVIDNMTSRGMNASDKDLDAVLDYLSDHLAPEKGTVSAPQASWNLMRIRTGYTN